MLNRLDKAKIARQYAKAWMEAAQKSNQLDAVYQDAQALSQLFQDAPTLSDYLANPLMNATEKQELVSQHISSKVSASTSTLINLLEENDRQAFLQEVSNAFLATYDEARAHATADVIVPCAVPDETLQRLKAKLEDLLPYNHIELNVIEDASILAGAVVKIGDQVLDGSYLAKLAELKKISL